MALREFQQNIQDITALPVMMGGLSNDVAAEVNASGAVTARDVENAIDNAFARQNAIGVNERMMGVFSGNSESIANLLVRFNRDQRSRTEKERQARSRNDSTTLSMLLDDLAEFEAGLAADYGDNFAENLFSDLNAKGLISDEDHKEVMSIQDEAERKKAMAAKIQEGLDDGTIKPEDLEGHPWSQEWLEKHKNIEQRMEADAQAGIRGDKSVNDMDANGQDETAKVAFQENPSLTGKFQPAAIGVEQSEYELEDTQEISVNLSNDLGGVSF